MRAAVRAMLVQCVVWWWDDDGVTAISITPCSVLCNRAGAVHVVWRNGGTRPQGQMWRASQVPPKAAREQVSLDWSGWTGRRQVQKGRGHPPSAFGGRRRSQCQSCRIILIISPPQLEDFPSALPRSSPRAILSLFDSSSGNPFSVRHRRLRLYGTRSYCCSWT